MHPVHLRIREPELKRPYVCPFYPIPPVLFVLATLGIVLNTIIADFKHALMGLGLMALGIPLYLLFRAADRGRKIGPRRLDLQQG